MLLLFVYDSHSAKSTVYPDIILFNVSSNLGLKIWDELSIIVRLSENERL